MKIYSLRTRHKLVVGCIAVFMLQNAECSYRGVPPLNLGSCSDGTAATFRIETEADGCSAGAIEWPSTKCFGES